MADTPRMSYNVQEAAEATGLSETTIWAMLKDGRLFGGKALGTRRVLIPAEELARVLPVRRKEPAE
jgi:excisionase family DNA binding protein